MKSIIWNIKKPLVRIKVVLLSTLLFCKSQTIFFRVELLNGNVRAF